MKKKVILSKIVFDKLSRHIVDFETNQNAVLDDSALIPPAERKKYQELFMQYCEHLQQLLKDAQVENSKDHSLPCVTIGSMVELENLQNKRTNKIIVNFPSVNLPTVEKIAQTSFNSPIGSAIFLKKPGDTVEVNAPGGVFQYQIKSIDLLIP